ncbi:MAG: ABC transporter ATP-binding protein, partial [Emcibacteraceae bacterium]|nr:ABC transporter ATP-binding protein [Emcibacteraceae bacterium]
MKTTAIEAPLLSVNDLAVSFCVSGDVAIPAVDGVSFSIKKNETVALVGESGSGKTVTALSILRLLPYPSAFHPKGTIDFAGHDILSMSEQKLKTVRGNAISMIFQEPSKSLNPLMTVEKQISETLLLREKAPAKVIRERVLELLDLVKLAHAPKRLGAYPHELSGGERQRIMIAMALAHNPKILIADEPTTALDVTTEAQILTLLQDIQKKLGMALLLITHDLAITRKMADRVCVMKAGKIVEQGKTEQIFDHPKHPYTKMLITSEPEGMPPKIKHNAKEIISTRNMKVHFPIKSGIFRRTTGHIKAVDGVDVLIKQGQTVGVVGESGSGKTTLALALLRLLKSDGDIVLD